MSVTCISMGFLMLTCRVILGGACHKCFLPDHGMFFTCMGITPTQGDDQPDDKKKNPKSKNEEKLVARLPSENILFVFNNYMSHLIFY